MGGRSWGKTVLGWFVVDEHADKQSEGAEAPAAGGVTAEDLIAKYANAEPPPAPSYPTSGSTAPAYPVATGPSAAPVLPAEGGAGPNVPLADGTFDFVPIFEAAGVDGEERGRVSKAFELLRALPAETPASVKKQIVEASLRAFGVATEGIIEAAVQEVEALEGFIQAGVAETQAVVARGNQRIAELEAEIGRVRQAINESLTDQDLRARAANAEKVRVQQVLEFFGQEAVAQVVRDSPRLHEPT
jgi:hypothetical protein